MTTIDPETWAPPVCVNGPHELSPGPHSALMHQTDDGRWICHPCWVVGGIVRDGGDR